MKKVFIFLASMMILSSCYKDRHIIKGQCGTVIDHHISGGQYSNYLLVIKFDDGITREVPVVSRDWFNFSRGERICF